MMKDWTKESVSIFFFIRQTKSNHIKVLKVEWFRFSAKAAWWKEEVALLEEEIR